MGSITKQARSFGFAIGVGIGMDCWEEAIDARSDAAACPRRRGESDGMVGETLRGAAQ